MDIAETRLANLLGLADNRDYYANDKEFAEKIGVAASYFSQVRSGAKAIGDKLARRSEKALGLAEGALDSPLVPGPRRVFVERHVAAAHALQTLPPAQREHISNLILALAEAAAAPATPT